MKCIQHIQGLAMEKQLFSQLAGPADLFTRINRIADTICKFFKKYGIITVDIYVDFAKDFWLDNEDAKPDKLAWYYEYVVKH